MLIRHALHGRRRVANATHHQAAIDAVAFACSTASQLLVQFSALDDDAFDLAVAFDGHRHGEKVEINGDRLVICWSSKIEQKAERLPQSTEIRVGKKYGCNS